MADTALAVNGAQTEIDPATLEMVMLGGDLSKLNSKQRVSYMLATCRSLGLNPLTKPFDFINLSGRLVMYAKKDCTEQLRSIHSISIEILSAEAVEGIFLVRAKAKKIKDGREDQSLGAVPIENVKGEAKANAMMKAETKAKRRVTLSICGLGVLDESEIDSIPGARPASDSGDSLEERLKASVALTEARKVAARVAPEAVEALEGEIVESAYSMPFASKQGKWEKGAPIESLSDGDLRGLAAWKGARDDLKQATAAELARRAEASQMEFPEGGE